MGENGGAGLAVSFPFDLERRDPILHVSDWSGNYALAKLLSFPVKDPERIPGDPTGSILDGFELCSFHPDSASLTTHTISLPEGFSVSEPTMLLDAYTGRILIRSGMSRRIHILSYL